MLKIRWVDDSLKNYGRRLHSLHAKFPVVLPRIVNKVGAKAKTQVVRNLTHQTGLPRKTIVKAIGDPSRARSGKLSYEMVTRGGNIRLKYLAPRETRRGVSAKPWNKRTLFPGTFMKAGWWPNRVEVSQWDGHVYRRVGWGSRRDGSIGEKITQARSGMFIPIEMTSGATAAAFQRTAAPMLKREIDLAIARLIR